MKAAVIIVSLLLSAWTFYLSLFWGWASGTGPADQPGLKTSSNAALAVSFILFWSAVAVWGIPLWNRRKSKKPEAQ